MGPGVGEREGSTVWCTLSQDVLYNVLCIMYKGRCCACACAAQRSPVADADTLMQLQLQCYTATGTAGKGLGAEMEVIDGRAWTISGVQCRR